MRRTRTRKREGERFKISDLRFKSLE
jgi:hypothetical protein